MAIRIVNLGDIHFESAQDWAADKGRLLGRAIAKNSENIDVVFLAINGDMTYSGAIAQFDVATTFLNDLRDEFAKSSDVKKLQIGCTAGNHDGDFSTDQSARNTIVASLSASIPTSSEQEVVLKPFENYFNFVDALQIDAGIDRANPYKSVSIIEGGGESIEIAFLNSAWMSSRHERAGSLLFPQELLSKESDEKLTRVVLMHHPANWFKQPDIMRELIRWITTNADICLSGHEHVSETVIRLNDQLRGVIHVEGGAFQESRLDQSGRFQILDISPSTGNLRVRQYSWSENHFKMANDEGDKNYKTLTARASSSRLADAFVAELDDPNLPGKMGSGSYARLKDIFVYPDCLEFTEEQKGSMQTESRKRILGQYLPDYLIGKRRTLLFGPEKCGKTSLAKQLVLEYHSRGKMPVLLESSALARCLKERKSIERELARQLSRQYASVTLEMLTQSYAEESIAIIDDFEDAFSSGVTGHGLTDALNQFFKIHVLIASEELAILETQGALGDSITLTGYRRLELCDLGHEKVQELTTRWLKLNSASVGRATPDSLARVISQVLATDFIPHHPWIVIVLLHTSISESSVDVSDGSYGHLYHAILTCALATEYRSGLDLNGKFNYLSFLAYKLYVDETAYLTHTEMVRFHEDYREKFDSDISLEAALTGLKDCRILRQGDEGISFNARYSYCFFLAWYFKNRIQDPDTQQMVLQLLNQLYHRESANILLFLSHLAPGTWALELILVRARQLFADAVLWNLEDDTQPILSLSEGGNPTICLPASSASENRFREQQEDDEQRQQLADSSEFDGRSLEVVPATDAVDNDWEEAVREVQSAFKMIRILGQVLKNNVDSMEATYKQQIVEEVFRLSRRMLGNAYEGFGSDLEARRQDALRQLELIRDKSSKINSRNSLIIKADKEVIEVCLLATTAVVRNVSEAVGARGLQRTYQKVLENDNSIPNRLYELTLLMENDVDFPTKKIQSLARDLRGNWFGKEVLRTVIAFHFYMYERPIQLRQKILQLLDIGVAKALPPQRNAKKPPRITDRRQ